MKKFVVLLTMVLFMVFGFWTVGADDDLIKIAVILPSEIDDLAWSQSMHDSLRSIQEERGEDKIHISVGESLYDIVDAGTALREYAHGGYDIVIAHGAQFQSVIIDDIAPIFPDTTFAYGTGTQTAPNVFAYEPKAHQGGYLLGMLAAHMTESGILGVVGPVEAGDAVRYNSGFRQGALAVDPDVQVRIAYTGSFGDLVGAGDLASSHIDAGADFLTGSAQQTVGAIRVVEEVDDVYWLSTDMDQSHIAPKSVLASQVYNFEAVVNQMLDLREEGIIGGEHLALSFPAGTLDLRYNEELVDLIPEEVRAEIEEVMQQIIDGDLVIELD